MVNSALFNTNKKKKRPKLGQNFNESFDSFSIMSPDFKNLTSAKLKYMINNAETFDLYNTKKSIAQPLTTSRKQGPKKTLKLDSSMLRSQINRGESTIGDASKSQDNSFNQKALQTQFSNTDQSNIQFAFNTKYNPDTLMLRNNSIQKITDETHIGAGRRSKSTARGQESFHNLGVVFNKNGSIGPSMLLKNSGSNSSIPRPGDYHRNLTKLHKYTAAGPGHYDLPQLFDNYKKEISANAILKKNPQYEFGIRYPNKMLISKDHMIDMIGINTPGVGNYKPIIRNTFDEIKIKNDISKQFATMRIGKS